MRSAVRSASQIDRPESLDLFERLRNSRSQGKYERVIALLRSGQLTDLEDNARPSRALLRPDRIEPDIARLRKYLLAYKFLTDLLGGEQYRAAMVGAD